MFFSLGHQRANTGSRVEPGDSRPSCTHSFRQRSLWAELNLQLPVKILPLKLAVLAHIAGNHLPDLPSFKQKPESPSIHAGVVAGNGKVADASVAQCKNQRLGYAAQAKSADCQQHPIAHNAIQRGPCIGPQFCVYRLVLRSGFHRCSRSISQACASPILSSNEGRWIRKPRLLKLPG